ncbi:MAG: GatB/YqeY domain-containing protein [Synergistes sp.]|nr:GatB/YqeY domain-containing protein [Synergistes sp.]
MPDLAARIQGDITAAMKNKDELRLSVLRMLKAAMQLQQIEKGKDTLLTDDDILMLVRRLMKQRAEAAEMYKKGGAPERADREIAESKVLQAYQPEQLSDDGIVAVISKTAAEVGAVGPKDMGKLMGRVMSAVKGQADGSRVRQLVSQFLSK